MSTLLVIGGTGFFGKSILDAYKRKLLNKWGIDLIYIFSRDAEALRFSNPGLMSSSIVLINGDICTCNELPRADFVIHAAASTEASKYQLNPNKEKENILLGTSNFCNLVERIFPDAKILYVSSGAVYGTSPMQMVFASESDPFTPLEEVDEGKRIYAAAKRESEERVIALGEKGISVSIARCFAFVGCYLPRNQHFAIGNFIQNGLKKEAIVVAAKGLVYRSYMYADDLVIWLFSILHHANPSCPIFNVGSDAAIEMRELAAMVSKKYGVKVIMKPPENLPLNFYAPSIKKAKEELGLDITYAIEESIEATNALIARDF